MLVAAASCICYVMQSLGCLNMCNISTCEVYNMYMAKTSIVLGNSKVVLACKRMFN